MYIGFSHSEILGSKLIYQLPEAYRRLLRPSSPYAAKASALCSSFTWSYNLKKGYIFFLKFYLQFESNLIKYINYFLTYT